MPFDSNGVFSLTPGYLAVTGETILPTNHNPPLEDIAGQGLSQVLVRDGRAPMIGNLNMGGFKATNLLAGTSATDAVNKSQLDAASSKYLLKSANYTAVVGDNTASIRFTVTATLSLATAASLGSGWKINVVADGGDVTIDPNASETINGQLTLVIPNGMSAEIICDGTNFFTVFKPQAWESIGVYNPSGASSVAITNLGAFRFLRVTGHLVPSTGAQILYRTSTNNGSSFDAGASDYPSQSIVGSDSTAAANRSTGTAAFITTQTATSCGFDMNMYNWNINQAAVSSSKNVTFVTAGPVSDVIASARSQATARNALQIFAGGGVTITGRIHLEGIRG